MSKNKQLRIIPSSVQNHGIKPPTTTPRPPVPPSQNVAKRIINDKYKELTESSNKHHDAVYDYIEANGADEKFQVHVQGMHYWLEMIAKRNGFDLNQ